MANIRTFIKKVSEFDQEIPQSSIADLPTAPRQRATEHYSNNTSV